MALIFVDGFPYDTANLARKYRLRGGSPSYTPIVHTDSHIPGARYLGISGVDAYAYRELQSYSELIFQFWWLSYNNTGTHRFFSVMDRGSEQISLWESDGTLIVKRGSTTLATADSATIVNDVWYQLELRVKIHSSTGTVLLKQIEGEQDLAIANGRTLDEITVFNLTGQNTQNTSYATINGFCMGALPGGSDAQVNAFAYIAVADTTGSYCNDLMGRTVIESLVPSGAGNYSQMAPSSGNNYACVDEIPPSGTDYVEADLNEIDTYTHSALTNTSLPILAVAGSAFCVTTDGGVFSLKTVARSSGSDGLGSEGKTGSVGYFYAQSFLYVDPATSAAFTGAAFAAAELGMKRTV